MRSGSLLVACAVALGLAGTAAAATDDATTERARTWRFDTVHGIVRVFVPARFDAATAATVIYVHGYYVDVDRAWRKHDLRRTFADADLNAMFIACEAPEDSAEPVSWRDLGWLLSTVEREIEVTVPRAHVVAVAHGGGARAVRSWLRAPELATIVLIDASHASTAAHYRWSRAPDRRLIEIADREHWRSRRTHRLLPGAAVIDDLAETAALRSARRIYVRARADQLAVAEALSAALRAVRVPSESSVDLSDRT